MTEKTTKTVQASNMNEVVSQMEFMINFVRSPYSFSLSFLKDPSIIG